MQPQNVLCLSQLNLEDQTEVLVVRVLLLYLPLVICILVVAHFRTDVSVAQVLRESCLRGRNLAICFTREQPNHFCIADLL